MSKTFSIACNDCKVHIWVGQGWRSDDWYLYNLGGDFREKLQEFLWDHTGHQMEFNNNVEKPGTEDWDDYNEIEWSECMDISANKHIEYLVILGNQYLTDIDDHTYILSQNIHEAKRYSIITLADPKVQKMLCDNSDMCVVAATITITNNPFTPPNAEINHSPKKKRARYARIYKYIISETICPHGVTDKDGKAAKIGYYVCGTPENWPKANPRCPYFVGRMEGLRVLCAHPDIENEIKGKI